MIVCGLKLTHDGAVSLIENGRHLFTVEMEKLNNNPRYTSIEDTAVIADVLRAQGCDISSIDLFAIDGWGGTDQDVLALQPRLEIGPDHNWLSARNRGEPYRLGLAPYLEKSLKSNVLEHWAFSGLKIGDDSRDYRGYLHVAGHILGAYAASPFSSMGEDAYILVWDGGMYPRLYFFDARAKKIENLGPIFLLVGNIYTIFSQYFGPFKVDGNFVMDNLSVAGKVMAYVALGEVRRELFSHFDSIYIECYDRPMGFANLFANEFIKRIDGRGYRDEDILASFHQYLEELLLEKLEKKVGRHGHRSKNLCLAGGCALNIKWNSAIRSRGSFAGVFVPPFPNDSGSAIGVACCALFKATGIASLDWSVYGGPLVVSNRAPDGWHASPCPIPEAARLLHEGGEPVIFLNGRAELGPRALGNRSILAPAISPRMKDWLNRIKKREDYRPVSPICLENRAQDIFSPGSSDPYMLFDHRVKPEWKSRIPAVLHLDGTARLQTINHEQNPVVGQLLEEYRKLSGLPLLCNTSANFKGCGFFPDVYSAASWDKVNYVWCENTLYERAEKIALPS